MNSEDSLKELRRCVEETSGIRPVKSKDFDDLVISIYNRTETLLSPTTLKRLWGYLKEPTVTRQTTLDILSRFCGWPNYEEFLNGTDPDEESGYVGVEMVNVLKEVSVGTGLTLTWPPSRVCEIEYLGEGEWKVLNSEGTRLMPGDTFRCTLIMSGEPLYLTDVVHEGRPSGTYICGRRNGIRFRIPD